MSRTPKPDELQPSDGELLDVVWSHTTNRRSVMTALGVGALASLGTGTAAAKHDPPHTPHIDPYYGYAAPADERLPRKLRPDHVVELHTHPPAIVDGDPTTMPFHFEPTGLRIDPGDVVRFDLVWPEHNVTAYHERLGRQQRVPDASAPFSSPVLTGPVPGVSDDVGFWLYRFEHPGTYDLFCAPHEDYGMAMRLVVGDPGAADYDGAFGPTSDMGPPRPPSNRDFLGPITNWNWPFPTAGEVLGTDALGVEDIVAEESVPSSAVEDDL
jgi:plastocyanin